jgi:type IV pilus assembly protein PilQ
MKTRSRRSDTMRMLLILFLVMGTASCATNSAGPQDQDIAEATSDVGAGDQGPAPSDQAAVDNGAPADQGAPASNAPTETSESDLAAGDAGQGAAQPPPPAQPEAAPPADQNPQAQAAPPAETQADQGAQPPPPQENQAEINPPSEPATITALDFKGNLNGGTVVVRTDHPVQYTTRKNAETNQFIIELPNTTVPKRFRRPYNTKEFSSPIAGINAYQSKKGKAARIVVQMRDASEPAVSQDGNIISVAGSGGGGENVAQNETPPAPEVNVKKQETQTEQSETQANTEQTEDEQTEAAAAADKPVGPKGLADFLTGGNKFYGKPISLELQNADIRDVFRFISEESGLNIVVADDVSGKVSLKLRKIPWDQALSVIMQSKQLGYTKQGNILRIAPLKTLQAESDSARNLIEAQRQLEPLHVAVFPVSYGKSEDLETQARDFLSPRGKAKADKRTNSLVVTDIDENLARIKSLIKRLDTQTPQVLIEAKVVEARESFDRIVGVNWNFNGNPSQIGSNTQGSAVNMTPSFNTNFPGTPSTTLNLTVGTMDVFGDLQASLQLLESERLVKVVSAPRIVTLDRVEATIKQNTQFPIFSSTPSAVAGQAPQTQIQFQDVQLQLIVEPQVTNDGSIIMRVDVTRQIPGPVEVSTNGSARSVDTRQAKTQVLVENGDTVVIGGVYQSDVAEGEDGTPWLRKIPIIGALFRKRTVNKDKNELVIFLTPRILNQEKAFVKGGGAG